MSFDGFISGSTPGARENIQRMERAVRRKQKVSEIGYVLRQVLNTLVKWFLFVLGVCIIGVAPGLIVARPLVSVFDEQVGEPHVFGFMALSLLIMSLSKPSVIGGEGWSGYTRLANSPASARMIYETCLHRVRQSARNSVLLNYLRCLVLAGIVMVTSRVWATSYGRVAWGALLLMGLLLAPAAISRALLLRRRKAGLETTKQPKKAPSSGWFVGLVRVPSMIVVALSIMALVLAADQVAITCHEWFPKLVPPPESLGTALLWLPHATVMHWIAGGPYPWCATLLSFAFGALTVWLMWENLHDRHLDRGLDDRGSLDAHNQWVGVVALRRWLEAGTDRALPKKHRFDVEDNADYSEEGSVTKDELVSKLRLWRTSDRPNHPAEEYLKFEAQWVEKTIHGWKAAMLWSLGFYGIVGWYWLLHLQHVTTENSWLLVSQIFLSIVCCGILIAKLIACLSGWSYIFLLPQAWDRVPTDLTPSLNEFFVFDRQQLFERLLWIMKVMCSMSLIAVCVYVTAPDSAFVREFAPHARQILWRMGAIMAGFVSFLRMFGPGKLHNLTSHEYQREKWPMINAAYVCCHLAGTALCFRSIVPGRAWLLGVAAGALVVGEVIRKISLKVQIHNALYGRTDRSERRYYGR